MRLSELMQGLPVTGRPRSVSTIGEAPPLGFLPGSDPQVLGVCHDSRRVAAGDLFVAWEGEHHDGRRFAPEAVERGAVAVLTPAPALDAIDVPWLTAPHPRRLLGPISARLYEHPDEDLLLIGVTGTNGKSTVVRLVSSMLEEAGCLAGSLGTLGCVLGEERFAQASGPRTTPEASDLFRALRQMRQAGAEAAVVEVSSHALVQGRVGGAHFDVAVFTNLSRDHFDFHADFESYFDAKRRLFDQLKPSGRAVVNLEDGYGQRLAKTLPGALTFGDEAAVRYQELELDCKGTRGVLVTPRGRLRFETSLLGSCNAANLLAATAVAEVLDLPRDAIARALARQTPLPGRLEPVDRGQPFPVLIDYAHTPGALEAALRSVRALGPFKVAVVFGCGGERDLGKRPLMGEVAGREAELPILTQDNPRGEDPSKILAAVERGLVASANPAYRVIPDRRDAIRRAMGAVGRGWALVVAGKGHEELQIMGEEEVAFSDREEVEKALEERFGPAASL